MKSPFVRTSEFHAWHCPGCKKQLNGITGVSYGAPELTIPHIGAMVVCCHCAAVSKIGEFGFEIATKQEWDAIDDDCKRATASILDGRKPVFLAKANP